MNCIGLVTARGGSKGILGKNIIPLAGKPLIAWTIEVALQCRGLERVIVSTDSPEIALISRELGAEVPFLRPAELARDDSPHIQVSEHAIHWLSEHEHARPDYMMLLQPTSPLRTSADIDAAIALASTPKVCAVVSATEIRHHPLLTYTIDASGALEPFVQSELAYRRRQDLPAVFATNGAIYLNRVDSLLSARTYVPAGALPYFMPPERSVDIDTDWDLAVAEWILEGRTERRAELGRRGEG